MHFAHLRSSLSWNGPRRLRRAGIALALLLGGCGEFQRPWHDQRLPSGQVVAISSCMLVWGAEHDERFPDRDSFALEYVATQPDAPFALREREARDVFELIRPLSELWGFRQASVAGFRSVERKGRYDLFVFRRGADGKWQAEHIASKVFAND